MRIKEYFDQFVRERQFIQNVTPATLEWYHTAWTRFGLHIEKATNEADLRMKIKEAMIAISSEGKLSPESVNTYFRVCQTFCNWLLENDIIKKQIKVARLRVPRKILETWLAPQPRLPAPRGLHAALGASPGAEAKPQGLVLLLSGRTGGWQLQNPLERNKDRPRRWKPVFGVLGLRTLARGADARPASE
jgi:hypothetical protein